MTDSDAFSVNTNFCRFCDAFLIGKGLKDGITTVTDTASLDSIANDLARDEDLRYALVIQTVKPLISG